MAGGELGQQDLWPDFWEIDMGFSGMNLG